MRILLTDDLACNDAFDPALQAVAPYARTYRWPHLPEDGQYDVLLAWKLPDEMGQVPGNVSFVFCFGAGADHLLNDPRIPKHVPIARLVDEEQASQILDYAAHVAFSRLLNQADIQADNRASYWRVATMARKSRADICVSVLGLGPIGSRVSRGLGALGFKVKAWSRSKRDCVGTTVFSGMQQFTNAVQGADVLINLLPLKPETENILSAELFGNLAPGAYLANLGRGGHLDETALFAALALGQVGSAWLDAFREEPLPAISPLWGHPQITITPHLAGLPTMSGAAKSLARCLSAHQAGDALPHLVRAGVN